MKRVLIQISLCAAAALGAPAALAGSEIVKCIDAKGHVTLTDQPCTDGATTVRMAKMPADAQDATPVEPYPLAAERASLPPRDLQRRAPATRAKAKPMQRDIHTLKEARATFLLQDAGAKHTLAGLN
jgi:hypothetical protein